MNRQQRDQVRQFANRYPDTLIAATWHELQYIEQLLDAVCRRHPKFEDYRKATAWKQKYGEEAAT